MKPQFCIFARKRLRHNSRVVRQSMALVEEGFDVTVVSLENPIPELLELVPDVTFIEIPLNPWPIAFMQNVSKVARLSRRVGRLMLAGVMMIFLGKEEVIRRTELRRERKERTRPSLLILGARKILNPFVNLARSRQFARRAARKLKGKKIYICQAHDSFALHAADRLMKRGGVKMIYDAVEAPDQRSGTALSGTPDWMKKLESEYDERIIQSATQTICVGPSLAKWTAERYSVDLPIVVRNCSLVESTGTESTLREDIGLPEGCMLGIVVGSVYVGQGLEVIGQAIQHMDPHIHIVSIGPESQQGYKKELVSKLEALGVSDRLHLLPAQPQNTVISYASAADFGVIALQPDRLNHRLALPNKIFEYIRAGLPVASGNIPDICSIIDKYGIGAIFDETSPGDIAEKINAITRPGEIEKLSAKVSEAVKELNWTVERKTYMNAVNNCIEQKN